MSTTRTLRIGAVLVAALALGAALLRPAAADEAPLSAFFGTYVGAGVATGEDRTYLGVTLRDLDVRIQQSASGFSVKWTTVLRHEDDAGTPHQLRKSATRTFAPTDRPDVYKAVRSGKLLDGEEIAWARIKGQALTVYLMTLDNAGRYHIQSYERTLSETGIDLAFSHTRDGDRIRTVTGKLKRHE